MLTSQLTPNLSAHIPKMSPQGALSSGIAMVPSLESRSQYRRSSASSSPLRELAKRAQGQLAAELRVVFSAR